MARTETHLHGAVRHPLETELAGGLAPVSKKPRLFLEAPAVGPITVEACVARRGAAHPEFERSRLRDGTHSRALRPGLARDEGAPPWPPETELAGALAPASKKPHPIHEATAVGPTTERSLRGAAGVMTRGNAQGFVAATHSRALRPDLVQAEAAGLGARAGFAPSIPDMERTR